MAEGARGLSVLLDTGLLYAFANTRDAHHDAALRFMREAMEGVHGHVATTAAVVLEVFTLLRARGQRPHEIDGMAKLLGLAPGTTPLLVDIVELAPRDLPPTYELFTAHGDRGLSFADASLVHTLRSRGFDALATFDGGFEGIVPTSP